ncbi:hypothetical protein NL676_015363 [Syzygium grande]|nr:hypothetical protein NL676_015363 [Syzygium grande]
MQDKVTSPVVSTTPAIAPSSPLHHTSEKRDLEDNNSISPIPYSREIHPEDFSFLKGQVRSSHSMPTSANVTLPDRAKDPLTESLEYAAESTPFKEMEENFHGSLAHEIVPSIVNDDPAEGASHSNRGSICSGISDVGHSFEDIDEEDVRSVMLETHVPAGKYHVKSSVSSILQAILETYGDIAENCALESISMRSDHSASSCKILEEISEVIEVAPLHQTVKAPETKCDQGLESMKNLLVFQTKDLAKKEAGLAEAKSKLAETARTSSGSSPSS